MASTHKHIEKKELQPLSDMQECFCQEYCVDFSGQDAAIRAGYASKNARTQGSDLLTRLNIVTRIADLLSDKFERIQITADWVCIKLKQVVDRCMQSEPVTEWDHAAKEYKETGEYKFDSKGAVSALALLGKHLGMFNDKIPVVLPDPDKERDLIFEAEKSAASRLERVAG